MKNKIIYIFLFVLLSFTGFSQGWSRYKYELFYGGGATNFMCDIATPKNAGSVWVKFWNTIGYTADVGMRYNFSGRNYVTGALFLGQLFAEDPTGDPKYWDRGLKSSSFFTELSGRYEFMMIKEKRRRTVYRQLGESPLKNLNIPTYAFVGLGATFNVGNFSSISDDGKFVETTPYTNIAPVIPVGIGFKFKVNRLTYVNLEAAWRFAMSDGLDNAKGTESAAYGKWIDQYQTITVNIVHKIRQNLNGTPRFKKR